MKDYFSTKLTCLCGLLFELNRSYLMRLVLEEYLKLSKVIFEHIQNIVGERHENRSFYGNTRLFFNRTYMFLWSSFSVQRILSKETRFDGISGVLKELLLFINKIWCSVGKRHENRRFFRNKRLFFNQRYMFFFSICIVNRMLSNTIRYYS